MLVRSTRRLGDLTPGGCPASCPDAHRPTHGHRHVRIWAKIEISGFRFARKKKSTRVQSFFTVRAKRVSRSLIGSARATRGATRRGVSASVAGRERLDAHAIAHEAHH